MDERLMWLALSYLKPTLSIVDNKYVFTLSSVGITGEGTSVKNAAYNFYTNLGMPIQQGSNEDDYE